MNQPSIVFTVTPQQAELLLLGLHVLDDVAHATNPQCKQFIDDACYCVGLDQMPSLLGEAIGHAYDRVASPLRDFQFKQDALDDDATITDEEAASIICSIEQSVYGGRHDRA